MGLVLAEREFRELVKATPLHGDDSSEVKEYLLSVDFDGFSGKAKMMTFGGIQIFNRNVNLSRRLDIQTEHRSPFFKMHFELLGHSQYRSDREGGRNVTVSQGCHQLFYLPFVDGRLSYITKRRKTLEINITLDHLTKIFDSNLSALESLGKAIQNNVPWGCDNLGYPITSEMKYIIQQILDDRWEGPFKRIYLESKVVELLILQFNQIKDFSCNPTSKQSGDEDLEKLHYIREIISRDMYQDYSLSQLAKLGGLNLFKLKKGFKDTFGNTVFGYIHDLRMEEARRLLRETNLSIAEIAHLSKYKNPQHFTASFKKKFGEVPSRLK